MYGGEGNTILHARRVVCLAVSDNVLFIFVDSLDNRTGTGLILLQICLDGGNPYPERDEQAGNRQCNNAICELPADQHRVCSYGYRLGE